MGEFLIIITNAEVPLWGHFNSLRRHASSSFSANGLLSTSGTNFAVSILGKGYNQWELVLNEDDSQRRTRFDAVVEPPGYPTNSEFLQLQDSVEQAEFLFPPRGGFKTRRKTLGTVPDVSLAHGTSIRV
jgi:hypothetical protein